MKYSIPVALFALAACWLWLRHDLGRSAGGVAPFAAQERRVEDPVGVAGPPDSVARAFVADGQSGSSGPSGLDVRIADDRDAPIEGAQVLVIAPESGIPKALGGSGADGRLHVERKFGMPAVLRTTCLGYSTEEILLEDGLSHEVQVRLKPSTIASGTVVSSATGAGVPGVDVLLWPATVLPAWNLVSRARLGSDASVLIARSDDSGRFEALGARPGTKYRAVAAGAGLASFGADSFVPGLESAVIRVGYLYGCRVQVVPADASPRLRDIAIPTLSPLQPRLSGATYIRSPSFVTTMLGLADRPTYGAASDYEYLFVSESDVPVLGPLEFALELPGFEPVSEMVSFRRVTSSIDTKVITLRDVTYPVAPCRFFVELPDGLDVGAVDMIGDLARIQVEPVIHSPAGASHCPPFQLRIQAYSAAGWGVELPLGAYEARLVVSGTTTSAPDRLDPPCRFEVGPDGAAVHFDLRECGGIQLDARTSGGEPASGALNLVLLEGAQAVGDQAPGSAVLLQKAPFLIGPLRAGTYTIAVRGHSFLDLAPSLSTVTVTPGVWTTLPLASGP